MLVVLWHFLTCTWDQVLLVMIALVGYMFLIVSARPYNLPHLNIMDMFSSIMSFAILFSGFLFVSGLLTETETDIVVITMQVRY